MYSNLVGLGWGPSSGMSNKLPGDDYAAGPLTTLSMARMEMTHLMPLYF